MKFYVAGKWEMRDYIAEIYGKIRNNGHEITEDWTQHPSAKPYYNHQELSRINAARNLRGVKDCDVLVVLTDREGTGMYVALGAAMMRRILSSGIGKKTPGPEIYVIGQYNHDSMHFFHPTVKIRRTIEEVLREVEEDPI